MASIQHTPYPYQRIVVPVRGTSIDPIPADALPVIEWIRELAGRRQRITAKQRPLLRGTLVSLTGWHPLSAEWPEWESQCALLAVWCPSCGRLHRHGWEPWQDGRVAEHRVAHCHSGRSLFAREGYHVSVWRRSDPGYAEHVIRPGTIIIRRRPEGRP